MRKFSYIVLIFLVSLSMALGGCTANRKPAPKPAPQERMTPAPRQSPEQTPSPTPNQSPRQTPGKSTPQAHNEAMKLSKAAEKIQGVKSATVVISDSEAFVGLETNANIEKDKTKDIKTKVTKEIKKTDSKIKTVNITTDPNLITRIKEVARGIEQGKPVSSFTKEIAEITRRITPSKE